MKHLKNNLSSDNYPPTHIEIRIEPVYPGRNDGRDRALKKSTQRASPFRPNSPFKTLSFEFGKTHPEGFPRPSIKIVYRMLYGVSHVLKRWKL
ncbi:hypothetical protein PGT21_033294 [Puccinia graminis f. sp. tritici]|uniref:Uncharacterized protein n=1 Tax=Puccinia graminis f. sp. tritici TaxID=56615 RepID=A0A5B0QPG9_PUCGR|nr:hypothetical protein PGT21_033294 [Puccinia graminis f. sp. tritici]